MPKLFGGIIAIPIVVSIVSLILNAILALLLSVTYSTLTKESIVATIQFDKIPDQPKVYIAHVYSDKGSKIGDYTIYGDQWRMDAGFVKMEYWANIFGIDSKYTLNRFEGRYKNIQDENNQKHKAYLLESHSIIDTFSFFVDTQYGSSVYQDIKLNTKYTVLKSQTGLMVREKKIIIAKEKSFFDKAKETIGY
jgi:hypothetical protein